MKRRKRTRTAGTSREFVCCVRENYGCVLQDVGVRPFHGCIHGQGLYVKGDTAMAIIKAPDTRLLLGYAVYALVCAWLYLQFTETVRSPYMDEPFHVKQTQAYCAGRWDEWDDKITTFPGLYLWASAIAWALGGAWRVRFAHCAGT